MIMQTICHIYARNSQERGRQHIALPKKHAKTGRWGL